MGRITAGVNTTVKADKLRFGYGVARLGLLVSAIMTALNCFFITFFNGLYYSGFAFTCPSLLVNDGLFWTGKLYTPEEYYAYWGLTSTNMTDMFYLYMTIGVALLAIGVLVVCYVFSKKYVGFLIAAVVLLAADKLYAFIYLGPSWEILPGIMLAAGLFAVLLIGIVSHFWLRMLEWASEPISPATSQKPPEMDGEAVNSPVLHTVDYRQKSKILMLKRVEGYMICYRKIGTVRELEIDKKVYDTVDAGKHEQPHELCAYLDGHEITVGLDMDGARYVCFDGETVGKVRRGI